MITRSIGALAMLLLSVSAANAEEVRWLYIQTAASGSFDGSSLVLEGVDPSVIAFSDRPQRLVRQMQMPDFLRVWETGPDSLAADAPNAAVSAVTADGIVDAIVVLNNPQFEPGILRYDVEVLEGTLPASAPGGLSIVIDSDPTTVNPLITD